jgi:hypothetical protein
MESLFRRSALHDNDEVLKSLGSVLVFQRRTIAQKTERLPIYTAGVCASKRANSLGF